MLLLLLSLLFSVFLWPVCRHVTLFFSQTLSTHREKSFKKDADSICAAGEQARTDSTVAVLWSLALGIRACDLGSRDHPKMPFEDGAAMFLHDVQTVSSCVPSIRVLVLYRGDGR